MKAKITKILISDKNKEFKIGDDIHFYYCKNNSKIYDCFGIITDIMEDQFTINHVEIDKMRVSDELIISFSEVKNGIIHYTDKGFY